MPIGSVSYSGIVRHAVDYTMYGGRVNIPTTLKNFPGFLQEERDSVKRVSFITANNTNYRKEFSTEVYSLDSRKLQFNNLFTKANPQIPDWEKNIRTYDYDEEGLLPKLPDIPWIPIVGLIAFWIYVNHDDKSR